MGVALPWGKKTVIWSLMFWWGTEPKPVCRELFLLCFTRKEGKHTLLARTLLGLVQTPVKGGEALEQRLEEE